MDTPVLDPIEQAKRVRAIAESEANNHDEVWDGVYQVSPSPNDEHQEIVMNLGRSSRSSSAGPASAWSGRVST
jgi:hypothetical protein